jgi:DNA-binding NarL/FixJ family response regulator
MRPDGEWRVVICDDHAIVREALRIVIESEGDFKVVAFAQDGRRLVPTISALAPDLVILDIEMPRCDGITAIKQLRELLPELRIIVFSAHEEWELIRLISDSGAAGFVGKSESASEILPAARAVLEGDRWFPERITDEPRDGVGADAIPQADELKRLRTLTPREREILDLFSSGLRTKTVAERIGISPATVYTHVRNAIHKLGVDSRTQAVVLVSRYSYLSPDPD